MTTRSIRLIMAGMAGLILSANAQNNLITNPGFEDIRSEPVTEGIGLNVLGWNSPLSTDCYVANTTDLFSNGSSSTNFSVPVNRETNGIPGGVLGASPGSRRYIHFRNGNERIFTNLTTPLFMHRQYRLSIRIAVPLSAQAAANINPSTPPPASITPVAFLVNTSLNTPGRPSTVTVCDYNRLRIPLTAQRAFSRYGEWMEYTAVFSVRDLMLPNPQGNPNQYPNINPLWDVQFAQSGDPNVNFRTQLELTTFGGQILMDDVSLELLPCFRDADFGFSFSCHPADGISLTLNGPTNPPNAVNLSEQFYVYLSNGRSVSNGDIIQELGYIEGRSGTLNLQVSSGARLMIKHGVFGTEGCDWTEERRLITVPVFNDPVNASFAVSMNPGPPISVSANAAVATPSNSWVAYELDQRAGNSIPNPGNTLWRAIRNSSVFNSAIYTLSNLSNNRYYLIERWARHRCSLNGQRAYVVIQPRY
ncbi:MAG: hypothetical protein QM534_18130 [Sediminibacterium sp.]|nr:hypothetical protein [Sediminibacterium sp.]